MDDNMKKYKYFFTKNIDYYILIGLILVSFTISTLEYKEVFLDKDAVGLYFDLPCFIRGQEEFIQAASFHAAYFTGVNSIILDKFFPGYGNIFQLVFDNIFGSVLIFGTYYFGKKLFIKYNIRSLRTILKVLLIGYITVVLIYATIITPIVRCMFRIG